MNDEPHANNSHDKLDRQRDELQRLAHAYCSESLAAEDVARLESLLTDEAMQRAFLTHVEIHAGLHWLLRGAAEPIFENGGDISQLTPLSVAVPQATRSRWTNYRSLFAYCSAAVMLIALSVWSVVNWSGPKQSDSPVAEIEFNGIAVLRDGAELVWRDGTPAPVIGAQLDRQALALTAGFAELEFDSGTLVVIEAPAQFEPLDALSMKLTAGRVAVRMPKGRNGFVVDCPSVQVLDEGTEFGVEVAATGSTIVQVYEGRVAANLKQADTGPRARRLDAGESLEVVGLGREARPTEFVEERFVRQLPKDVFPSNESRHEAVFAPFAAQKITIDGDLSDWNLSRRIRSECRGEFGKSYYLEAAAMYDREHLYLSAHVGDPAPMVNQYDPQSDPAFAWRGGGMHLRVAADASFGWPLEMESEIIQRIRDRQRPTVPVSSHLFGFYMWHYAPRDEACLLRYPELRGGKPQGAVLRNDAAGRFRRDADGRGYTLEYAIAWRVLNIEQAPQAGDVWPAVWNLHWSADGRNHLGHLIEVTNPVERANLRGRTLMSLIFHRTAMWGRLVFEAPPAGSNPVKSKP